MTFPDEVRIFYDCLFIKVSSSETPNRNIPNSIIGVVYRSPSHNNERQFINSVEDKEVLI